VLGFLVGLDGGLGFDVLGAFAIGVGGAAPELALGFAGGAAAHGFSTEGTEGVPVGSARAWTRAAWRLSFS
jgi:hypothetical protein